MGGNHDHDIYRDADLSLKARPALRALPRYTPDAPRRSLSGEEAGVESIRTFMNPQTETTDRSETPEHNSSAETVLGFIIIGLLAGGTVGVVKAYSMTSGLGVMCCLFGSVAAFGAVYYIYFGKR